MINNSVDIFSTYKYYNNETENINILNLKIINVVNDKYILKNDNEELELTISDNYILVSKNSDISYTKIYEYNKFHKSILNIDYNIIITNIKTTYFHINNNEIHIKAKEYDEFNNFLFDIEIRIYIRRV